MPEDRRLIEVAFPLNQASLDSMHEKRCHAGHIKAIHSWPARRPLAASRAALIAALLPDPGDPEKRKQILERMAGRVIEKIERKKVSGRTVEKVKEETIGGILHWGRENDPDLDWFRREILKASGGRVPKVLDPFAGGGAIPLEAMRLGCEVTAIDINPVAWFILKCTLEYPQKLSGQTRPLPGFALEDRDFMESFLKANGFKGAGLRTMLERLGLSDGGEIQLDALPQDDPTLNANLAWHVRAWGRWVLAQARKVLAPYYPTYAHFEPLEQGRGYEQKAIRLLELDENGVPQLGPINAEFDAAYLEDPQNPRWVAKPTVAYLWARTAICKHCRATIPLVKTRWIARKSNKRILLNIKSVNNGSKIVYELLNDTSPPKLNPSQRRERDRKIGLGTVNARGAVCPCCDQQSLTTEDIRLEGKAGRLGLTPFAVVIDGIRGKEYRQPTEHEEKVAREISSRLGDIYSSVPHGLPDEPISADRPSPNTRGLSGLPRYGFDSFSKLFVQRQLAAIGEIVHQARLAHSYMSESNDVEFANMVFSYLTLIIGKLADYNSSCVAWQPKGEKGANTFVRWALPLTMDFSENNIIGTGGGSFLTILDWVARPIGESLAKATRGAITPTVLCSSALEAEYGKHDIVLTDPPYYDAIPYADLMDFFYVWMKRCVSGVLTNDEHLFRHDLTPKWNSSANDGELVDQPSRFGFDQELSRSAYENGMYRVFKRGHTALNENGRLVIVFANKQPAAWETLVAALVKAGFVVDASWPIQTEMANRTNAQSTASLASSVWLVCRKRINLRPGWDNKVLHEMRENITHNLRDFWDSGIRGPDFVWAATGPALEAFSRFPVIKKADDPGQVMSVSEFLREVRRIVVDFVVGRVLTLEVGESDMTAAESLDDLTTYYLLHRHDFGMEEAPIGACILYAMSCNLSDSALVGQHDLLVQSGKASAGEEDREEENGEVPAEDTGGSSGAKVKLKAWNQRRGRNLGLQAPGGRPVPMIDQVHRLIHLWRAGDQVSVDDYLESRGLKRNVLFNQLLQALIELSTFGSDERSMLESLSNHVAARERIGVLRQGQLV